MKRMILLFSLLAFAGPSIAVEIGVIAQFSNRRPPFNKLKGVHVATGDINGDGITDIAVMQGCTLNVFDPVTRNLLWEYSFEGNPEVCTDGELTEGTEVNLLGFVNLAPQGGGGIFNNGTAIIAVELDGGKKIIAILIAVMSKQIVYEEEERIVAVLELPNGRPAVATYVEQENLYKIVGEIASGNSTLSNDVSFPTPSFISKGNYALEKKFQADAGLRLAYDPDLFDPRDDMDLNGDGRLDIPMLIQTQNNQLVGMVVRGGNNLGVLWQFPFPEEYRANILKGFHGFVDVNGDGEKEAIFGENLAVTLDGTVHTIAENFVTLDVNDIDNDGFEDIIGLNTADSTVVIYGAMMATSVGSTDPAAEIHFQLFQNYPNPFNPNTTISYSVAQSDEVRLTVFNALGQAVRTLVAAPKAAGEYSLTWDGRDDIGRLLSSGSYFYRLQIGEAVQTRRMLFLK